jgi:hypothetical protein
MYRNGSNAVRQNLFPNTKTYVLNSGFYNTPFYSFLVFHIRATSQTHPTLLAVIPNPFIIHCFLIFEAVSYEKWGAP